MNRIKNKLFVTGFIGFFTVRDNQKHQNLIVLRKLIIAYALFLTVLCKVKLNKNGIFLFNFTFHHKWVFMAITLGTSYEQ